MWSEVQAGKTALVSPPRICTSEAPATAQALAGAVVSHLSGRDVRLAQALVDTHQTAPIAALAANGFRHLTDLLYLVSLRDKFPDSPPQSGLEFAPCDEADDSALAAIIERTYAGSLDCPAIEGWRDVNDVLEGYRAVEASASRRWLIVRSGQLDVGCLLLNDYPELNQWELVYMGLVGEARGRGWGMALVRYAQWLARQAGRAQMVLAVDAANAPAIAVYAAAGFITWDRRSALVRKF
jgi:ribosomal protein S18 acetylase RimI-like enzyme